MARRVFFSFHFQNDSHRVSQVRNSWIVRGEREAQPFLDAAAWEEIERSGEGAIKRWIDLQLKGTSVTIVLIGNQTAKRPWVNYEIIESYKKGNGLLGIYIHNMKNLRGQQDNPGHNPFLDVRFNDGTTLAPHVQTYDWVNDNGRMYIGSWIEAAAKKAER
jgi:hypothetical protein